MQTGMWVSKDGTVSLLIILNTDKISIAVQKLVQSLLNTKSQGDAWTQNIIYKAFIC